MAGDAAGCHPGRTARGHLRIQALAAGGSLEEVFLQLTTEASVTN